MELYRLLNGIDIPCICYGTWRIPNGETAVRAVASAIECGYRSIDTAAAYKNEESVGEGIRASGISRSELFVTTKLWNSEQGYDSTLRAFDASMQRLGLDYLDLYLIHWPGRDKYIDTWKAFIKLYNDKRIRSIGVSNFLVHHIETLKEQTGFLPMVNQIELHPYLAQSEAEEYCKNNGIIVETWSPLMGGGEALRDPLITLLAEKYAKTPAQIILRWHYQIGRRILTRSVNSSRIKENINIFNFAIDETDIKLICGLSVKNQRTGGHPDTNFMGFE